MSPRPVVLPGTARSARDTPREPAASDSVLLARIRASDESAFAMVFRASVGKGRALLDLGGATNLDSAGRTVVAVPIAFNYLMVMGSYSANNHTSVLGWICYPFNFICNNRLQQAGSAPNALEVVSDREGGVGYNFVSAHDPRLMFDSTDYITQDSLNEALYAIFATNDTLPYRSKYYAPLKFGIPLSAMPAPTLSLATGVEAALIRAEAALASTGGAAMVDTLQVLRQNAAQTYLNLAGPVPLMTGTDSLNPTSQAAMDMLFRERAFWLFGLGNRPGDMRREVRNYGVPVDSVYPHGAYLPGLHVMTPASQGPRFTQYGTDVSLSLPTPLNAQYTTPNPYYRGCIVPTNVP